MAFTAQYSGQQFTMTFKAAAAVTKYEFVTIAGQSDGECADCSSAGEIAIGVAQNAAATGQAVRVCVFGITKVNAGAAVTKGDTIQTDATARAIAAASADEVMGQAIETAAAAGDVITALINYAGIF